MTMFLSRSSKKQVIHGSESPAKAIPVSSAIGFFHVVMSSLAN
jgi:hypothetical protein